MLIAPPLELKVFPYYNDLFHTNGKSTAPPDLPASSAEDEGHRTLLSLQATHGILPNQMFNPLRSHVRA